MRLTLIQSVRSPYNSLLNQISSLEILRRLFSNKATQHCASFDLAVAITSAKHCT